MTLFYIIVSTFVISLASLIGAFTYLIKESKLNQWLHGMVAVSAGAMIATSLLHLLPEAAEKTSLDVLFPFLLTSFILFMLIEKVLHWRHCHKGHCDVHTFGTMNLIGDGIHNFIDGLIIAVAFMTSWQVGLVTVMSIALHEIPQEISDFGVLIYSGYGKKKALMANLGVGLTSVLGGVVGYFASAQLEAFNPFLLIFAAGGFLYIAASDLIPEMRKQTEPNILVINFLLFLVGIGIVVGFNMLSGH